MEKTLCAAIAEMDIVRCTYQNHPRRIYPLALIIMVVSAVVPYIWFKRRGWL